MTLTCYEDGIWTKKHLNMGVEAIYSKENHRKQCCFKYNANWTVALCWTNHAFQKITFTKFTNIQWIHEEAYVLYLHKKKSIMYHRKGWGGDEEGWWWIQFKDFAESPLNLKWAESSENFASSLKCFSIGLKLHMHWPLRDSVRFVCSRFC